MPIDVSPVATGAVASLPIFETATWTEASRSDDAFERVVNFAPLTRSVIQPRSRPEGSLATHAPRPTIAGKALVRLIAHQPEFLQVVS